MKFLAWLIYRRSNPVRTFGCNDPKNQVYEKAPSAGKCQNNKGKTDQQRVHHKIFCETAGNAGKFTVGKATVKTLGFHDIVYLGDFPV